MRGEQVIVERDALSVVLNHADPSPWEASELMRTKTSYGMAWLVLRSMKKEKISSQERLQSVNISNCEFSTRKIVLLLASLPKSVKELKFGRSFFDKGGYPLLCGFLKRLAELQEKGSGVLCLRSLCFLRCKLNKVQNFFTSLPLTLEELNLYDCCLDDAKADQIFHSLPLTLEELGIDWNSGVSASRWSSLGARLESLERLKTLRLSWCELYDEKVEMFFPSLPVTLEELHLQANNKISSVGWASLGTRLKSLEQLKKLDLYSCGLEAAKVQSLFPSLPTSLEHLNLSGSHLGIDGCRCLEARLRCLDRLRMLDLSWCGLQDGTSQLLFPSLPVTLEDLDLQGNENLGMIGWTSLKERLEDLQRLKKLDLSMCDLNNEKIEHLFPSAPDTLEELVLQFNSGLNAAGCASLKERLGSYVRIVCAWDA